MREGGYKIIDFKNKAIEDVTRWDVIRDDIINSDGKSILISGLKYGGKVLNDFCTTVEVNAQNYIFLTIIATSTKCVDLVIMENEALYRYYYLDQIDKKIADGDKATLKSAKEYTDTENEEVLSGANRYTDETTAIVRSQLNDFKTECYEHNNIIYLGDLTSDEMNQIRSLEAGSNITLRTGAISNAVWNCASLLDTLYLQLHDPIGDLADNPSTIWLIPEPLTGMNITQGYVNTYLLAHYTAVFDRANIIYEFDVSIQEAGIRMYSYTMIVSKHNKE
jgi:hypothetical protein